MLLNASMKSTFSQLTIGNIKASLPPEIIGVCAYLALFAFPFKWDIALIILALMAFLFITTTFRYSAFYKLPLFSSVLIYLGATMLTIVFSENIPRSIRLSLALIPSTLLFFLTCHFRSTNHTRLLFGVLSALGLCLSSSLLLIAILSGSEDPFKWVKILGSPIIVVKNDITFLAILAPLSLVMLYQKPKSAMGILSSISILTSICVISIFNSRTALLTLFVSLLITGLLLRPRMVLFCCIPLLLIVLFIIDISGFTLIERFRSVWDPRIAFSLVCILMFLDAPLLGHGPHTFGLFYLSYLPQLKQFGWLPFNPQAVSWIDHRAIPWPHNLYFEILSEQGLVGASAFLIVLIVCGLVARKTILTENNEIRVLAAGVIGALAGFLTGAFFELSFLRQWVVVTLFLILGTISHLYNFRLKHEKEGL